MKVKQESEKVGLKLNTQKMKIMASGPITSWQIDGETVETERLYFLGSRITADGDCSMKLRRLLLGREAVSNPDSTRKSRDATLPTQVCLIKERKWKKVESLSCVWLFATPWTVAYQAPLSMRFSMDNSTGVGCHFLLQGIFPTQGLNPGLPHCRQTLYRLSHQRSPII